MTRYLNVEPFYVKEDNQKTRFFNVDPLYVKEDRKKSPLS